jgi:UrcA family protein
MTPSKVQSFAASRCAAATLASLVLCFAGPSRPASAAPAPPAIVPLQEGRHEAIVRTDGVDFTDQRLVQAFYRRLELKAAQVCDSSAPRQLDIAAADRACARVVLDRAVSDLGRPALSALHRSVTDRSRRPQPGEVARAGR